MKYLAFIRHAEAHREAGPPPALMEAMGRFVQKSLQDGFRVQLAKGVIRVIDGPFAESKEVIGGWAILKADSKAAAQRIAEEFMELHRKHWPEFEGESEVRLMFEPGSGP